VETSELVMRLEKLILDQWPRSARGASWKQDMLLGVCANGRDKESRPNGEASQ